MSTNTTTNQLILYVDDEEQALKYFDKIFSKHFDVITAASTDEALEILEHKASQIAVLITDQRMPKRSGVELLAQVREQYPHIVRILTTAYAELDNAIDAVNRGEIFRYITKPWNIAQLKTTLSQALEMQYAKPECSYAIAPYAILAAGLSGRFRGCKLAVSKLIEHWPAPSAINDPTSTAAFVNLADTLNHASSAMDDDLTLVALEEQISHAPGFAGKVTSEDRSGAIRFVANARLMQATLEALARISQNSEAADQNVDLKSEIRNKVPGIVITWQIMPMGGSDDIPVNWSPDLLMVYLFTIHHGGQVAVNHPSIELWIPQSPRDVDVKRHMDNWLVDLI
tara:strand:+ start:3487 stop:4509 length:1023 start_codon:yes stop_codon:yes gene_type:complete